MNKLIVMLATLSFIVINNSAVAMKELSSPVQPQPASMTGAFFNLPEEVKNELFKAIAKADTKDLAAYRIHKLLKENPALNKIVNTPQVTEDLINILANKSGIKVYSAEEAGQEILNQNVNKVDAALSLGATDWLIQKFKTNPTIKNAIIAVYAALQGDLMGTSEEDKTTIEMLQHKIALLEKTGVKEALLEGLKKEFESFSFEKLFE